MEIKFLKRNILLGTIVILISIFILIYLNKPKYKSQNQIPLINQNIKVNIPDNVLGIYLSDNNGTETGTDGKKYSKQSVMPSSGYKINEANSYCERTVNGTKEKNPNARFYTDSKKQHIMVGLGKGDKCYVYFDRELVRDFLLKQWGYEDVSTITERTNFSESVGGRDTVNNRDYVYKTEDNDGTSYYLAGDPEKNWVKFANYYWRIVRINGDGSLRMILSNDTRNGDNIRSIFNAEDLGYWYAGYMYREDNLYGSPLLSSAIKLVVDDFYVKNLDKDGIREFIDTKVGFCSDLSGDFSEDALMFGFAEFSVYGNLVSGKPSLVCQQDSLLTVKGEKKGNQGLDYPIGLIDANEVLLSGLTYSLSEGGHYLVGDFWTLTPANFNFGEANVVAILGGLTDFSVLADNGVFPVVSLVSSLVFSRGDGTSTNPFEI